MNNLGSLFDSKMTPKMEHPGTQVADKWAMEATCSASGGPMVVILEDLGVSELKIIKKESRNVVDWKEFLCS